LLAGAQAAVLSPAACRGGEKAPIPTAAVGALTTPTAAPSPTVAARRPQPRRPLSARHPRPQPRRPARRPRRAV